MGKHALLVGVRDYEDRDLHSLPAVAADLECLSQVLEEPAIGGFEVEVVRDPNAEAMQAAIGEFLDARTADDLVLLYLSGHGTWSPDMGQLYFATGDTHLDRLPETGVSAGFLNNVLEECQAQRKVLLLDCCYSGAYVQGFRTRGGGNPTGHRPPLASLVKSRGAYVITASDQRQAAYEISTTSGEVQPSLFTGAVVKGLKTGQADGRGNGAITPHDLYIYVRDQLKLHEARTGIDQSPTMSSGGVVGRDIELARSRARPPSQLRPLANAERQERSDRTGMAAQRGVRSAGAGTRLDPDTWVRLLDYYRDCLTLEAANDDLLLLHQAERQTFALWTGAEEILVGDQASVPVPPGTPAEELIRRAQHENRTLAYGYPAVLLFDRQGEVAPLFTRVVEPFRDDDGWHLHPVGAMRLHAGLLKRRLGSHDPGAALAEFEPGWSAGSHSQLVHEATKMLEELDLPTEMLRPTELDSELNRQHPRTEARNVALLYEAAESNKMSQGLFEDLGELRERTAKFAQTALGVFAPVLGATDPGADETRGPQTGASGAKPFRVVAPFDLNEAQEAVLRSAMTRRLTVATGPPGTGKSQLVANLVTTAVANEQSVVVTSTNNRAVDEVWERCNSVAPGLLIRTGNRSYDQAEAGCLRALQTAGQPDTNPDWHRLRLHTEDRDETRDRCAQKIRTEAELLELSLRRHAVAGALGFDPADLPASLASDANVDGLRRRAQSVLRDPVFGRWRRRRLATLLCLADSARETCSAAAEFLQVEARWRRLRADADRLPSDAQLAADLHASRTAFRETATELVKAIVAARVQGAQHGIEQRLGALRGAGSWRAVNKMRPHLMAWAVTTLSARRLPLDAERPFDLVIVDEATQCSIPAVLPMLYRAKRVLIIGDPMQLTHVTTCTAAQNGVSRRAAGLGSAFLERVQLDFVRHSAFHAAAGASGEPPLMLDEHFRCHPDIIALPNRLFYGERLTVLTDPKRMARAGNLPRLTWMEAAGSPARSDSGSWHNPSEIETVREVVANLRNHLPPNATIGVVTPFASQAKRINKVLEEGMADRVGTAHAFQGGECDAMVLSVVGGPGMRPRTVSWLERSDNLWNVAITRARAYLVVVGDRDYWRGRAGVVGDLERGTTRGLGSLSPPDGGPDATGDALHRMLEQRLPGAFDRDTTLEGYSCDFRIDLPVNGTRPADSVGIILDRGVDGVDPARHLRLQLERCDRLRAAGMSAAHRVPAWQVHTEPDRVISAVTAGIGVAGSSDDGDRAGGRSEPRRADRGIQSS
ncbi:MAG: caspase, EACC1-associated type [Solirubrobacteraceae bacterium]